MAELLGVHTIEGAGALGIGVAGLTVSPLLGGPIGLILGAGLVVEANARSKLIPDGVERARVTGRRLAATSIDRPLLVLMDDVEVLHPSIAEAFLCGIIELHRGTVLAIVTSDASAPLAVQLRRSDRLDALAGRVHAIDVPTAAMTLEDRRTLIRQLADDWPASAVERLANSAESFADIYRTTSAGGAVDVPGGSDPVQAVDDLVRGVIRGAGGDHAELVTAWCGGILHVDQLTAALDVLGQQVDIGEGVTMVDRIVRLRHPIYLDRLASMALARFSRLTRSQMATAISECTGQGQPIEQIASLRCVMNLMVRELSALPVTTGGIVSISELADLLERFGDLSGAAQVTIAGLQLAQSVNLDTPAVIHLRTSRLRLAYFGYDEATELIEQVIALPDAPIVTLEGKVWAAIGALGYESTRNAGIALAADLFTSLDPDVIGDVAWTWQVQLSTALIASGVLNLAREYSLPLLTLAPSDPRRRIAERALIALKEGPGLYDAIILESMLLSTPLEDKESRLQLVDAVATEYDRLGVAEKALHFGAEVLDLRLAILGADHPGTLTARSNLASWIGATGHPQRALEMLVELLADLTRVLGPDHHHTLLARNNIASWTGESGDPKRALELSGQLLPDLLRVLGPDHPGTLNTRNSIAAWTGESGDPQRALELMLEVLPDLTRVLGPDHPRTLNTRKNVAGWTGESGDPQRALELMLEVLPDLLRVLGPDHPWTLNTRKSIAAWTGEFGDPRRALELSGKLHPALLRVLGPDHPDTLSNCINIAVWTGESGDPRRALELLGQLLPDLLRVLGPDHPDTLNLRNCIASWTGQSGDSKRALELSGQLLPDLLRVLGPDHPDTLKFRNSIAVWTGESGDSKRALELSGDLLPALLRVLGPDHPHTLNLRNSIAGWTGESGDSKRALELSGDLLPDLLRVLGPDHPHTLNLRNSIAGWTGESGDSKRALQLSGELLSDLLRVLGPDHPDTLRIRNSIANWTGVSGDSKRALELSGELLSDRLRVLGPDHPDTLNLRNSIAGWTGMSGDPQLALELSGQLLPDLLRVLGPDHPDSLNTRKSIAIWTSESGDPQRALEVLVELLSDEIRVLGPDHPKTLSTRNSIAALTGECGQGPTVP